jgi:hypothetical protein
MQFIGIVPFKDAIKLPEKTLFALACAKTAEKEFTAIKSPFKFNDALEDDDDTAYELFTPAVIFPTTETDPDPVMCNALLKDELFPAEFKLEFPIKLPVTIIVPEVVDTPWDKLFEEFPPVPAVILPVIIRILDPVVLTPTLPTSPCAPPLIFPVIVNVPVEECDIAAEVALNPVDAPVTFPTIAAEFVPVMETVLVFVLLCIMFAANVTPLVKTKLPPAEPP